MARRLFNGNEFSEDGWPYVDEGSCTWIIVPGTDPPVHLQIQNGPPLAIMGAFAADINAYVEHVRDGDSACWTPGNSVATSNHPGGTAMDIDWELHPFHVKNTFNPAQQGTIRELLDWYEGTIFWGGDWEDPIDEMHWQMGGDTYDQDNDRPFPKVQDFINRKIRSDGFSKFRREGVPIPPPPPPVSQVAQVLADATGLDFGRAAEILPTVSSGLQASQCNNVNRIAMWLAQCGEESAGFSTTEEFASGAEYEGRCSDLGNCSPGDGVKYKGRTWIQITGKAHYQEFSEWAFSKGFVHTPTQFVDDPGSLGDLRWAGIGAAWYWTVSRPDINALSDAGDVVTVTHRINGGEHGLADRQNRYARAHALGDQLLALPTAAPGPLPPGDDMSAEAERMIADIHRELTQRLPSRSPLRHLGEGTVDTMAGMLLNTDSSVHVEIVKLLASLGHPESLALLREVASADPSRYPDRQSDKMIAQAILADLSNKPYPVSNVPTVAPVFTPPPQVVYLPAVPEPATNGKVSEEKPKNTGDTISDLYQALESMHLADALPIEARAPLAALISILQTKNGSQV